MKAYLPLNFFLGFPTSYSEPFLSNCRVIHCYCQLTKKCMRWIDIKLTKKANSQSFTVSALGILKLISKPFLVILKVIHYYCQNRRKNVNAWTDCIKLRVIANSQSSTQSSLGGYCHFLKGLFNFLFSTISVQNPSN